MRGVFRYHGVALVRSSPRARCPIQPPLVAGAYFESDSVTIDGDVVEFVQRAPDA
jgi:hypothetical protein